MMKLKQKGFTILELLIASMVFSALLILCIEGVTRIAKVYVKNSNISRANNFTKTLIDDIGQQIKFGSSLPEIVIENGDIYKICVAGKAYKIVLNTVSSNTSKPVLLKSDPTCENYQINTGFFDDAQNIAPYGMRISDFNFVQSGNLWEIKLRVALGANDLLEDGAGISLEDSSSDYRTARCKTGLAGSEYCAVIELNTTVNRRKALE